MPHYYYWSGTTITLGDAEPIVVNGLVRRDVPLIGLVAVEGDRLVFEGVATGGEVEGELSNIAVVFVVKRRHRKRPRAHVSLVKRLLSKPSHGESHPTERGVHGSGYLLTPLWRGIESPTHISSLSLQYISPVTRSFIKWRRNSE